MENLNWIKFQFLILVIRSILNCLPINVLYKFLYYNQILYYTNKVALCVGVYHKPLRVNRKSIVTRNVLLGKNVNFNGMMIIGTGKVRIGDNFHSGIDCMMITKSHVIFVIQIWVN